MGRLRFASRAAVCATVVLPVEEFSLHGQQCLNQITAGRRQCRQKREQSAILIQGRGSAATADKHLVPECPFLTMVPVMAVSDLVAGR
jgi:hypothetical protein